MEKTISAQEYLNLTSARWDAMGIDRAAKAYDQIIAYGKQAAREVRKAVKLGFYDRASNAVRAVAGYVKPALYATAGSVKRIGNYLGNVGKGVVNKAEEGVIAYTLSEEYRKVQDMYKTYTNKDTQDRTERVNAETQAQTGNVFQRTAKAVKNVAKNAKEYRKIHRMMREMSAAGIFATPLQAYALKNDDWGTFVKMTPEDEADPKIKMNIGGKTYGFADISQFAQFMKGMSNIYFMNQIRKEAEAQEQARCAQNRHERDITDEVEVSSPVYSRNAYGGIERKLLTAGIN